MTSTLLTTSEQTTELTLEQISAGIEHSKAVIAAWDEAVEEIAEPAKAVAKPARKMSSVETSMPAWMLTGRTTNGTFSGRVA